MSEGRFRRAYLGIAGSTVALPPPIAARVGHADGVRIAGRAGQPGRRRPAPRRPAAAARTASPSPHGDLQRIMTVESIGRRMEATVLRNGALVDVVLVLRELPA
jgi:hypothetical protein